MLHNSLLGVYLYSGGIIQHLDSSLTALLPTSQNHTTSKVRRPEFRAEREPSCICDLYLRVINCNRKVTWANSLILTWGAPFQKSKRQT